MATAVIKDVKDYNVVFIKQSDSSLSKVYDDKYASKISQTLPFRVKFINVGITAYGPNNPAPIGIAIVGYSNYVL
jgi:hypothetical protein